ncbi:hypothetical protein A9Q99_18365 [Gammaproteobacteria bacterium 45_16_T64]|nr:hypothetical protein A9Q99_18365 [Gammaproteobacteria bacterium 45_16_T64]
MSLSKALFEKRTIISIALIFIIAIFFWTQSRVPALNEKAMMGDRTVFSGLAFDSIVAVNASDAFVWRVVGSSLNWAYTNWKGMAFGLLIASAFLVLFHILPKQRSNNYFFNVLKGVVGGAPLGVCVNCTTPIAQGLYKAGIRLETVLATLISSPTLNVVVLTMSFTLLPIQYAITKLICVLVVIFVIIPLIVHYLYFQDDIDDGQEHTLKKNLTLGKQENRNDGVCEIGGEVEQLEESWPQALRYVGQQYITQLIYIIKTTLPFMLLAGVLGALFLEALPSELLTSLPFSLLSLVIIALVGVFLPVPIAFDVIVVSVLLSAGLDAGYGMALLFALGSFSIYPMLIISKNISKKVAFSLFLSIALVAILSAIAIQVFNSYKVNEATKAYEYSLSNKDYSDVLIAAEDVCQMYMTEREKTTCLGNFILQEFMAGASISLCNYFDTQKKINIRRSCDTAFRYADTVAKSVASMDATHCAALGSKLQGRCESDFINSSLEKTPSLTICSSITSPSLQRNCKNQVLLRRLNKYGGISACSIVEGVEKEICLENVRIKDATRGGKAENCDVLPVTSAQEHCRFIIAIQQAKESRSVDSCVGLPFMKQTTLCQNEAFQSLAIHHVDLDICHRLKPQLAANECKRVVNQHLIDRKLSSKIVSAINVEAVETRESFEQKMVTGSAPVLTSSLIYEGGNVSVYARAHMDRPKNESTSLFVKDLDVASELRLPTIFGLDEFHEPFSIGRGIASGDFNNDGWPDLVFASKNGPILYKNIGGRFARQAIDLSLLPALNSFVVSLVDIDNDGWLDIFVSAYNNKNYFIINDKQGFRLPVVETLEATGNILTMAAGFADIDNDGDLDGVLGNWSYGSEGKSTVRSQNFVLLNDEEGVRHLDISEVKGETLSILLSDINGDLLVDAVVGNDFNVPDQLYSSDGKSLVPKHGRPRVFPASPLNTMSIDSADFNNDLQLDIFSVDMSFGESYEKDYCGLIADVEIKNNCLMVLKGREKIERRDTDWCTFLSGDDKNTCLRSIFRDVAIDTRNIALCERLPREGEATDYTYCLNMTQKEEVSGVFDVDHHITQVQRNVLLLGDSGKFNDLSDVMGVSESYWSWNAKAADLDNDGWQDIYVANGIPHTQGSQEIHSNIFFHNVNGEYFKQSQEGFGLEDYLNTPSYVYIDYDLDGDLDIIATAVVGPVRVYENREFKNHSINIELNDSVGNVFGIGSKVIIEFKDGSKQLRELKASGGFLSHDAPVLHFGLNQKEEISSLQIIWSTGETSVIPQNIAGDHYYRIVRKK